MTRLNTKLTRLLRIRTPVVSAPMAGASGGALAAHVSLGGGFGFLSAGYDSSEHFKSQVSLARSTLQRNPNDKLPIGVGFLGWQLEKPDSPVLESLAATLSENVEAVWFAFGQDLGRWIKTVRDHDEKMKKGKKTVIFVQICSIEEALVAINDWKVDVLVVQGIESGGHGANYALPLFTLLPLVLSVVPNGGPPVLAAGGLANGYQVASLLNLGASGAVLGTRFLLASESLYNDSQKQALIAAKSAASVRTMAFDHARGTLGWPHGIDGRGLWNSTVEDYEKGVDIKILQAKFTEGTRNGDADRIVVWAGTGVGLMDKIQPAEIIVEELHRQCVECLKAASLLME